MSIHYLIDPFTTAGDITDVLTAETGQSEATGSTVIRVPDGVAIHNNPTNITDLLTAKYDGLLASYAGFTDILADTCMGGASFNLAASGTTGIIVTSGWVNAFLLDAGLCFSVSHVLGFAPTQCVLVWEEYIFTDSDDKADRFQRTYVEETGVNLVCGISFNGGSTYNTVLNGEVLNIPVPDQGTSFIIRFQNTSGKRIYLGSWALLYL